MKMHRAQILLDPEQHKVLRDIANRQGRSISSVVRDLLNKQLNKLKTSEKDQIRHYRSVVDNIEEHRREIIIRHGNSPITADITGIIEKNREERDDNILNTDQPISN